jgi:hypothetical protein
VNRYLIAYCHVKFIYTTKINIIFKYKNNVTTFSKKIAAIYAYGIKKPIAPSPKTYNAIGF